VAEGTARKNSSKGIDLKEKKAMCAEQSPTTGMKVRRIAMRLQYSILALALTVSSPLSMLAQNSHSHGGQQQESNADLRSKQSALIKTVRQYTERFQDPRQAGREGYVLTFGCVSGPDQGAMGLHFVNFDLVGQGVIDPTRPQIVIYEPTPDGGLKLIGADFLVMAAQWDSNNSHKGPPQLAGQLFHYFEAPNRFGLDAFYTLHVWAWKENPNGAFVNWHPDVSCQSFTGPTNN
jgi:hypothetical protein